MALTLAPRANAPQGQALPPPLINVARHRLGPKEIESAALTVPEVPEAAVAPVADEIKGRLPDLYVSLKPSVTTNRELEERISDAVVTEISPIARPRRVWIVPDMLKTRSGKIMRRVLASISGGQDASDVSTLANPEVVDELRRRARQ
ncbi:MAG TPA: hypothetical protein VJY34_04430 [Roseiarcus sp.]|nr:hypothetical protein [Roseiarcus sp.]